jgi:hypothetical protein
MADWRQNHQGIMTLRCGIKNQITLYGDCIWEIYLELIMYPFMLLPHGRRTLIIYRLHLLAVLNHIRDETINYINKLRENDIPVYFEVYKGCFYALDLVGANTSIGKKVVVFLMETFNCAVGHYFSKQPIIEKIK